MMHEHNFHKETTYSEMDELPFWSWNNASLINVASFF